MTFSASSMLAWCRYCTVAVPFPSILKVSLFQFALPAVVFNVLLQINFTPPHPAASEDNFPSVIVSSSCFRNSSPRWCFRCSNDLRAGSFFVGLFFGRPDLGIGSSSKSCFRGDCSVLRGECWSFHVLTTSADQNESRLGRCGGVGMRAFFKGDTRRDLLGLGGGEGVRGRLELGGTL